MSQKNYPIKKYSNNPDSHDKAMLALSAKYKMAPAKIRYIVLKFFGRNGLKFFIAKKYDVRIINLGVFYFHIKTAVHYKKKIHNRYYHKIKFEED